MIPEILRDTPEGAELRAQPIWKKNCNMLVPYYLMANHAYYELDNPIMSDAEYDEICQLLLERWDDIKHWHKGLLDKESLIAGTGFATKTPERVKSATLAYIEKLNQDKEEKGLDTEDIE